MSFEQKTLRDAYFIQQEKELKELLDPQTGMLSEKYSRLIPCPLCESKQFETIFIKRGYTFVRCKECGLVYTNPQVCSDIVENAYSGEKNKALRTTELWMDILLNQEEVKWRTDYFTEIIQLIEDSIGKKGRILDIGCAVGQFLSICRELKWETVGLELSEKGSKYCRDKLGLEVHKKTLAEADFENESFDAVTLLGVLEHMTNPKEVLLEAVKKLKKDGLLVVIVPNMYSLYTMMMREKAVTFDGREHMIFFSMDTLKRCFKDLGLNVKHGDTVLTGIPNMVNYAQFNDPYGPDQGYGFLPEPIRGILASKKGKTSIEKWVLKNNLGLRLRMLGKKI